MATPMNPDNRAEIGNTYAVAGIADVIAQIARDAEIEDVLTGVPR